MVIPKWQPATTAQADLRKAHQVFQIHAVSPQGKIKNWKITI